MKIKRTKRKLFESSSVLSDLAFLLIIYFIVIAGFNINHGYLLNLPEKNSTRLLLKDDILRYELNESGAIMFMGQEVNTAEAEQNIAAAVKERPNLAVLLTISQEAPWQNVVAFVEIAEKLSVDSFSFKMNDAGE
ncbi:MAG: biopolymer transporter ExbD [Spirochaetaceae bacterium]|jgi:biopolymer transport protein ExbD|nr:biopolymer transporter ExbD [Spirochaetaceae bacterium]